ncbi:MAG: thiamine ABC transporter substrate-binding protein, partial [Pseudomonadota bacterium]
APHGQDNSALTLPIDWTDDTFLPFNYGHTAFIYNETLMDAPPASFDDLLALPDDVKIVIQDPRTSISGLALVLWVQAVYGDRSAEVWQALSDNILTVTKDWSASYGLFTDGEADMVLSYTTSPAYHMFAEEDFTKKAAIFPEGHYFMVETVAKISGTDQPELADRFLAYVMSRDFQTIIPTANWSLPSALPQADWPEGWSELPLPEKVLFYSETEAADLQASAIETWRAALSQ